MAQLIACQSLGDFLFNLVFWVLDVYIGKLKNNVKFCNKVFAISYKHAWMQDGGWQYANISMIYLSMWGSHSICLPEYIKLELEKKGNEYKECTVPFLVIFSTKCLWTKRGVNCFTLLS